MKSKGERLRESRAAAGYASASQAARAYGWRVSTYIAHENGQNDYNAEQAELYATAFKTDAEWLLWGRKSVGDGIDAELKQLDPDDARRLIEEFNNMIRAVKLIRRPK